MRPRLTSAIALLACSACLSAAQPTPASDAPSVPSSVQATADVNPDSIHALDGEWTYVEDRTEGQPIERLGPPMAGRFSMRVEPAGDAVILNGHGSGHRDVRVAIDGTVTEVPEKDNRIVRYRGSWKDATFQYEVDFGREPGQPGIGKIRRTFHLTPEGLIVRVAVDPTPASEGPGKTEQVGLYRHEQDIPLPTPAKAAIADLAWFAGAWVGTRSSGSSIEERWSPPRGGAMLAVSRTVNAGGKMVAFEYLRIVERQGGLVYIAQPGGAAKTEFALTEFSTTENGGNRAVFENPRHDYPKRIVYERSPDGTLTATIGYTKGGTPRTFTFSREAD